MIDKRDYVRQRLRDFPGNHDCHWPGCTNLCAPSTWGCRRHWMMLPKYLRDKVWLAYRPGQEISKTPSRAYVEVAREVRRWIEWKQLGLRYDL